jgi:hypothetical protein
MTFYVSIHRAIAKKEAEAQLKRFERPISILGGKEILILTSLFAHCCCAFASRLCLTAHGITVEFL